MIGLPSIFGFLLYIFLYISMEKGGLVGALKRLAEMEQTFEMTFFKYL